ncbi:MAG: helix-turn-helix transcriptional regulator [Bacteroidales bacterium]|nr:helix-turn-helix transcriptional regulator [Bacteroidales bacterium]
MRSKDLTKIDVIFGASLRLIKKEGIAGITMAKIAREAGIATGTLYIYFKNKEELINGLYNKLERTSSERFVRDLNPDQEFRICLKKVWLNYLKHRIEHHDESIFLEQYYYSPYITMAQKKLAEEMKAPVYQLIKRGKSEGLLQQDSDIEMLFMAMIGFIRALADEHVEGRYILNELRINKGFELNWNMIKE